MTNTHTCAIGNMNLLLTYVGLLHLHLLEIIGEVVGGTSIHVQTRIHRRASGLSMGDSISHGQLTSGEATIITHLEEIPLKMLEAA
jgi:hypothetical protein